MAWRDQLREATFRGVPFLYDSTETGVGRRTVVHEFPGRDEPYHEDLGRRARPIRINAYVLGEDYDVQRDRLRRALEAGGAGELVHPYWGEMQVVVEGEVTIRETPSLGGMARFSISFKEAGGELEPVARDDTKARTITAADDALAGAEDAFDDAFDLENAIGDVRASAEAVVNDCASKLRSVKGKVDAALNATDSLGSSITALAGAASTLIQTPGDLANRLNGLVAGVLGSVSTVSSAAAEALYLGHDDPTPYSRGLTSWAFRVDQLVAAHRLLYAFGEEYETPPTTTPQRTQEGVNQAELVALFRRAATIEACRVAVQLEYESFNQATAVRDELAERIDELLEDAPDDLYGLLVDLRAWMAKHLSVAAQTLPHLVTYTPTEVLPALVLAHRLYGDPKRDREIIDRNSIRNPAAIPAGEPLEVLTSE